MKLIRANHNDIIPHLYECELVKPHSKSKERDYYITSYGRFISIAREPTYHCKETWKFLTVGSTQHKKNYYHHSVWMGKSFLVHREVGKFFLPDFKEELDVCHRDENVEMKYLHSVWNLWMGTPGDNLRDAYDKKRVPHSNAHYNADEMSRLWYRLTYKDGMVIDLHQSYASEWLGFDVNYLRQVGRGRLKSYRGVVKVERVVL